MSILNLNKDQIIKISSLFFGVVFVIAHCRFSIPHYDDGVLAYHILNTIDFTKPFFNDMFDEIYPFQKLSTIIFSSVMTYILPFSFKVIVIFQGILIILSTILLFYIAKIYLNDSKSILASSLFLYFLLTHTWISANRSELWLLPTMLIVVLLCERFLIHGHIMNLMSATVVIGLIGMPVHTNSTILYIYIVLFLWFYRDLLSLKNKIQILFLLALSSFVGLLLLIYPDPDSFLRFMNIWRTEDSRFTFILGELKRLTTFIRYRFYRFGSIYFIGLSFIWIINNKFSYNQLRERIIRYKNIFILGFAIFLSLGFLPSAEWDVYILYYLPPIVILFTILHYSQIKFNKISIIFLPGFVLGFLIIWIIFRAYIRNDLFELGRVLEFFLLAIPILLLCVFRIKKQFDFIYIPLIIGIIFRIFMMSNNYSVYHVLAKYISDYQSNSFVLGPTNFVWVADNDEFQAMHGYLNLNPTNYLKPGDMGTAILGIEQTKNKFNFDAIMARASCSYQQIDSISSTFNNSLIYQYLKDVRIYEFECFNN